MLEEDETRGAGWNLASILSSLVVRAVNLASWLSNLFRIVANRAAVSLLLGTTSGAGSMSWRIFLSEEEEGPPPAMGVET